MSDLQQSDSIGIFFRNFGKHLSHIRDEGKDSAQSYRAQILMGQLDQFEKAIQEYSVTAANADGMEEVLSQLMEAKTLAELIHWVQHEQKVMPIAGLYFLNRQAQWEWLFGAPALPQKILAGEWIERGLLAKAADTESGYLIYCHGIPRLYILPEHPERYTRESVHRFLLFFGRMLPMLVSPEVKRVEPSASAKIGLVARDAAFLEVLGLIGRAAQKDVTILLEGESGTGKEVLADYVHRHSSRSAKPLITINCAAIPPGLIESELFGHEKGAFTGAYQRHIGCVERADGGTLFLDEIGEMEISMQAKLLRFLQLQEFHRVGGRQKISVNVRIVAATNRDLKERIKDGLFREDLYYRLSVMPFRVPALRERVDDILPLIRFFLDKYTKEFRITMPEIDPMVYQLLASYHFPGNIRQLENLIQSVLVLSQGNTILTSHLPEEIRVLEPKGRPVLDEKGAVRTWRRVRKSYRKMNIPVQKQIATGAGVKRYSWEGDVPKDNDALKHVKNMIQEFARNEILAVERRFLSDLLERAEGSMPEASSLGHINRTLLYKMLERTGLKPNVSE